MTALEKRAAIRAKLRRWDAAEGWGWLVLCLWRLRREG